MCGSSTLLNGGPAKNPGIALKGEVTHEAVHSLNSPTDDVTPHTTHT